MSSVQKLSLVKFAPKTGVSFYDDLKARVDNYFTTNKLDVHGDASMKMKTVAMVAMYVVPYLFMVSGVALSNLLVFYGLWLIMGVD